MGLCKAASMSTLIVCTDGSDLAVAAARSGLDVLQPFARVVVATVVEPPDETLMSGASGFAGGVISPEEMQELDDAATRQGEAAVRSLIEELGITGAEEAVLFGNPGRAVCDLASQLSASVIVMGSRGRGGIKRAVLGSVSDHVTRHAPCPVLIVGHHD